MDAGSNLVYIYMIQYIRMYVPCGSRWLCKMINSRIFINNYVLHVDNITTVKNCKACMGGYTLSEKQAGSLQNSKKKQFKLRRLQSLYIYTIVVKSDKLGDDKK